MSPQRRRGTSRTFTHKIPADLVPDAQELQATLTGIYGPEFYDGEQNKMVQTFSLKSISEIKGTKVEETFEVKCQTNKPRDLLKRLQELGVAFHPTIQKDKDKNKKKGKVQKGDKKRAQEEDRREVRT